MVERDQLQASRTTAVYRSIWRRNAFISEPVRLLSLYHNRSSLIYQFMLIQLECTRNAVIHLKLNEFLIGHLVFVIF